MDGLSDCLHVSILLVRPNLLQCGPKKSHPFILAVTLTKRVDSISVVFGNVTVSVRSYLAYNRNPM